MATRDIENTRVGLMKLVDEIEVLAPQCIPGYDSDVSKCRDLRKATLSCGWARSAIENYKPSDSFQAFVVQISKGLQRHSEIEQSLTHFLQSSPHPASSFDDSIKTFMARFGRNPRT